MIYNKACNVEDALAMLRDAGDNALILAGGTDIMPDLNKFPVSEKSVVYVGDIAELREIKETANEIRIGSLVTASQIESSKIVEKYAAALREAAMESAAPQVRNRATIGGNIATASPAGDMLCALYALNASIAIGNSGDIRKISDVVTGIKKTSLNPGDLITEIIIPKAAGTFGSAFLKIGKRKAMTISIACAACAVSLHDGRIEDVRVAIGSAAPTVVRATAMEDALKGEIATESDIDRKSKLAADAVSPITDQRATKWYRKEVAPVLAARAFLAAVSSAENIREVS